MKKIKISLAAIAFVAAIGSAFASNTHSRSLRECTNSNPVLIEQNECPGAGVECCQKDLTTYFKS